MTVLTAMMIKDNECQIIDTEEYCECWTMKDGVPHALMLSCPIDRRSDLEKVIAGIKNGEILI